MADKTTMTAYNKTGFASASGVSGLKAEVSNLKTDDASLRQQAVDQYADTFKAEQQSLQSQLSALITAQNNDSELLNKQYEKSISTMMSQIKKRGLDVGGLPRAQTDALEKFHNEVMTQRHRLYDVQRSGVQAQVDTLEKNYDANITRRTYDIKNRNLKAVNSLLVTMAELQSGSYQDYINYLLAKQNKSRRSSTKTSTRTSTQPATTPVSTTSDLLKQYYETTSVSSTKVSVTGGMGGGAGKNLMATK